MTIDQRPLDPFVQQQGVTRTKMFFHEPPRRSRRITQMVHRSEHLQYVKCLRTECNACVGACKNVAYGLVFTRLTPLSTICAPLSASNGQREPDSRYRDSENLSMTLARATITRGRRLLTKLPLSLVRLLVKGLMVDCLSQPSQGLRLGRLLTSSSGVRKATAARVVGTPTCADTIGLCPHSRTDQPVATWQPLETG